MIEFSKTDRPRATSFVRGFLKNFASLLTYGNRLPKNSTNAASRPKKAGMQFGYHNHWFEFLPTDGKLPYDELLKDSDASLVKMEMDLCWIIAAGTDPLKYFEDYPGRFPLVHVKDVKTLPKISRAARRIRRYR